MRRSTRTHIRRGLAAATITALVTTGATTAVVATAVSSAQAYDRVQAQTDTPPERGSIHEEAARQAASSYREKAQEQRATEERIRSEVVDIALDQIGDNYVAGGEGPNAFDCSGLVVYAYKSVGIKLTHYSRAQYRETERVSLKNAVPGDLAFYFENGAAHVAIYIGNGKVVHASDYGIGVVKGTVKGTPWTDAHFTGMGRVEIPVKS
ncbi:MAG: NlpC/P60 family protein [Candidatus Nanopelagicales bacterium]|jgi:cell wall-associated NlpC family hydrolase